MLCIIKLQGASGVASWIIAADAPDARRQAEAIGERQLASELYRHEFGFAPGKHFVCHANDGSELWALAS